MDERKGAAPRGEEQAAAYVALCERLLGICESASAEPVKQGVQAV